ncbi:MAG TPA: RNA methyltransferase [Acidimicrobiales bacterium]|nr:RNA methyltransferase [Acidimicrobiales bacterium]
MATVPIDDPDDPRIEAFTGMRDHDLRLRRESPGGDLDGIFLAEGDIVVERALSAGYRIRAALIDATRTKPLPAAIPSEIAVFTAGPEVVRRITGMAVHRGMMAVFERRPVPSPETVLAGASRVVVLERVVNPTNLGIIARSARGLGADALLLDPAGVDPLYRRASRVSMGEVFGLPYARLPRFPEGLGVVVEHGFTLVALTPELSATSIDDVAFAPDDKVALVLGSEGPGLAAATMERIGLRVRIPLHGGVDSLNVAAAAAIACHMLGRGRA